MYTPATVINQYEIQCYTPNFTQIVQPLQVGLYYPGLLTWPPMPTYLTLIEMPTITGINGQ